MTTIHEAYKLNQIIRNASAQRENKYMVARELWKAIAVPKIMSNDEVIGLKKKHLQQMEKTQNQIARFALGAPKYAAVESLRGEMGWSQFSERYEKGLLKIGGKIEMMEKNRYLSKIVKSREGYNGFGKEFQNAIDKTGNRELATRPLIGPSMWKKKVEEIGSTGVEWVTFSFFWCLKHKKLKFLKLLDFHQNITGFTYNIMYIINFFKVNDKRYIFIY